jgi:hypothetical protein
MKWGIALIVIGAILLIDGTIRFMMGLVGSAPALITGGVLTGWLLGGWVLYSGIKRLQKYREPPASP